MQLIAFYFSSNVQPFNSRHYAERMIITVLRNMFTTTLHDDILHSMHLALQ